MCHRPPKNEHPLVLPPWGEKGGPVGPLKGHIPLLTTEKSIIVLAITVGCALVLETTAECPECTLGLLGGEQERPVWEPPQMGLQPGGEEAICAANAERIMKSHRMSKIQLGLASQAFQEPESQAWGSPSSTPRTLGSGTELFSLSHRAAGQKPGWQGAGSPTSATTQGCFQATLLKVMAHSPLPGFGKGAGDKAGQEGAVTFPPAQTSLSAPNSDITTLGRSLPGPGPME